MPILVHDEGWEPGQQLLLERGHLPSAVWDGEGVRLRTSAPDASTSNATSNTLAVPVLCRAQR